MDKWRVAFLYALGGKCVRCDCKDLRLLEIHDTSGEHRGYHNKQRLEDIRQFRLTGRIPPGRFLLCVDCHDVEHGSDYTKVKAKIEDELRKMKDEK